MPTPLTNVQIDALREIDTPTMSNIIELFDVRPRNQGFMSPAIRCQTPHTGIVAGYACTAAIKASEVPAIEPKDALLRYLEWSEAMPAPRISVIQDLDEAPFGAMVGEVCSSILRACGFVAWASNGTYRDVDQVVESGLAVFCPGPCVSHGYIHVVDYGRSVEVGGLTVAPGDLLHADQHGVLKIPHEIAADVAGRLKDIAEAEGPVISLCKSDDFSLQKLRELVVPS